ncbi:MAG: DUF1801 domain-containing protein [Candidatus Saccharimonadales bacterium]
MAYTPKTKVTDQSVDEFLETVSEKRRDEAYRLIEMMQRVSTEEPRMWGPSMIGFGKYHYVSKSKCEADWFKIGFSPRKAKISLYLSCDADEFAAELSELGKHTRGKGCIYANKLEDIDMKVLEKIAKHAYESAKDYDASK